MLVWHRGGDRPRWEGDLKELETLFLPGRETLPDDALGQLDAGPR